MSHSQWLRCLASVPCDFVFLSSGEFCLSLVWVSLPRMVYCRFVGLLRHWRARDGCRPLGVAFAMSRPNFVCLNTSELQGLVVKKEMFAAIKSGGNRKNKRIVSPFLPDVDSILLHPGRGFNSFVQICAAKPRQTAKLWLKN